MILKNLKVINNPNINWIEISNDQIAKTGSSQDLLPGKNNEIILEFKNALAFPGLINSHDHLEFNLFPKLGHKKYEDYIEWGEDIHLKNKNIINEVQAVPFNLRYAYGIYKNLLNGITSVLHHGKNIETENKLIDVITEYKYLHSVQLEKRWKLKLNNLFNRKLILIHIGEGRNEKSHDEIDRLIKWNLFKKHLIGIHSIMMDERQAGSFKAVIWCPDSNEFLYGLTCKADVLKNNTSLLFGTDSNVSADWSIWNHLRFARNLKLLSDTELFDSLTISPSNIWKLPNTGLIKEGFKANLIVAENKNSKNVFDSFFSLNSEDILLVLKNGNIVLFDTSIRHQLNSSRFNFNLFTKIRLNGKTKFVLGRLDELCSSIKKIYPAADFPFEIF